MNYCLHNIAEHHQVNLYPCLRSWYQVGLGHPELVPGNCVRRWSSYIHLYTSKLYYKLHQPSSDISRLHEHVTVQIMCYWSCFCQTVNTIIGFCQELTQSPTGRVWLIVVRAQALSIEACETGPWGVPFCTEMHSCASNKPLLIYPRGKV